MTPLIIIPLLLLASCSPYAVTVSKSDPYDPLEPNFITDLTLKKTNTKTDLRDLLLTLPVFEVSPKERRDYVYKEAKVTGDIVQLKGDGAQGNLTLEKLNDSNLYKFTYDDPGDKGNWVYLLKRRDHIGYGYNGWHIESKQYNKK